MSRPRPSIASRTAFDLLTVEPGEETESEEEDVVVEPVKDEPAKPSKSALRKAARLERKEARKRRSTSDSPDANTSPSAPAPVPLPTESSPEQDARNHAVTREPPSSEPPTKPTSAERSVPVNGHTSIVDATATPALVLPAQSQKVAQSPSKHPNDAVAPKVAKPSPSEYAAVHSRDVKSSKPLTDGHAPETAQPQPQQAGNDAEKSKKLRSILTRTLWTFIMIGGFIGCLLMGHVYMVILVMLCQTLVYREVTRLFMLTDPKTTHTERDVWSKTLSWYFFAVANYFLYGESIIYYFKHVVFADANLLPFATNHRIVSFSLYTIGFMGFVMSLQKGYLQQQFGLFCWVHMSLLLIVVSSHFIMNNILEGLIWFWVPASLVICNDIFAYVWGMSLGRTPLIKLSPKKTVEGFVGAFISTIIFGILWGTYFARFDYMICPVHDLGVNFWSNMHCTPNSAFVWREWQIWPPVAAFLSTLLPGEIKTISFMPYQIHLLFMACFASLVAPFGGFFASGFKRAFNIKDFGHSIPGHGGMTDRMDCQFLMGVFTYVFYSSLVREHHVTVGSALQMIVSGLTFDEQLELMRDLKYYLEGQGITVKI